MRQINVWKKIALLKLLLVSGCLSSNIYGQGKIIRPCESVIKESKGRKIIDGPMATGDYGSAHYPQSHVEVRPEVYPAGTRPLQIISKPRAPYTDRARNKCIQGVVRIKVTFFADGKVGNLKIVNGLASDLNAQVIEAAKKIRFEPAMKNNKMVAVIKTLQYNFTIY